MKSVPVVFGSKQTARPFGMWSPPNQISQPDSGMQSINKTKILSAYICTPKHQNILSTKFKTHLSSDRIITIID